MSTQDNTKAKRGRPAKAAKIDVESFHLDEFLERRESQLRTEIAQVEDLLRQKRVELERIKVAYNETVAAAKSIAAA